MSSRYFAIAYRWSFDSPGYWLTCTWSERDGVARVLVIWKSDDRTYHQSAFYFTLPDYALDFCRALTSQVLGGGKLPTHLDVEVQLFDEAANA